MADYQRVLTSNTLLHTGPGCLTGMLLSKDTSGAANVIFYDGKDATGTPILSAAVFPSLLPFTFFPRADLRPRFSQGLYIVPNGATVVVWAYGA